jgi:hypothetical protein
MGEEVEKGGGGTICLLEKNREIAPFLHKTSNGFKGNVKNSQDRTIFIRFTIKFYEIATFEIILQHLKNSAIDV